jgi:ParB-like chromosome segregation protein Spo0J
MSEQWTSRKVEQFVVDLKKNRTDSKMPKLRQVKEQPYKNQLQRFQDRLKTDVNIQTNSKGAGQITIRFKNEQELERIQEIIG